MYKRTGKTHWETETERSSMSKKRRIGDKLEKENDVEDAKGAAAVFFFSNTDKVYFSLY